MNYYLDVLKKYAVFEGRARRKEYWIFFLISVLINLVLNIIDMILFGVDALSILYSLAVLIPGLAVSVRRLHDTGRSGWWILLILIPIVGSIVFLVFMCLDSQTGVNQYGANPKDVSLI